jgi:hypothetical protein
MLLIQTLKAQFLDYTRKGEQQTMGERDIPITGRGGP